MNQIPVANLFDDADPWLVEKFNDYHAANPGIYDLFKKYSFDLKVAGRKRYSQWTIINKIRWDNDVNVANSLFKISNDYISLYARKLVQEHPTEFKDFFKLKKMKKLRKSHTDAEIRASIESDTLEVV